MNLIEFLKAYEQFDQLVKILFHQRSELAGGQSVCPFKKVAEMGFIGKTQHRADFAKGKVFVFE